MQKELRKQIVIDIINLMWLEYPIATVQRLIKEAYGISVQAHGVWKIYHTYRCLNA